MIAPISPFGLIQESLYPNEWYILLACMMLNCTSRKQVDSVLPVFIKKWPAPKDFLEADVLDVENTIKSLGFKSRRTKALREMTQQYLCKNWKHVIELKGIGNYAARSWEIFCKKQLGSEEPKDHALVVYWKWAKSRKTFDND